MEPSKMERSLNWWMHIWCHVIMTVIMVLRPWSWWSQHMTMAHCYSPNYCNSFLMFWLRSHLCGPWLICSRWRSGVAKDSCDCSLLMSCSCNVFLQLLYTTFSSSKKGFHLVTHAWVVINTITLVLSRLTGKSFSIQTDFNAFQCLYGPTKSRRSAWYHGNIVMLVCLPLLSMLLDHLIST